MAIRFPKNMTNTVVNVIKPRPPIWTHANITSCPKTEKWVPVSTTASPVTQVAETAVKKASVSSMDSPVVVATGSASRKVPAKMTSAKLRMTICVGLRRFLIKSFI